MFLQICQNSQENTCTRVSFLVKLQACGTFFTEHHKATASILREGKRLNQIEISIISKLDKENNNNNNNKRKCSYIFDFLIVALILSLYYIILYYIHYVQTCWIWKTYLNKYIRQKLKKKLAHFKILSRIEVFTRLFLFFSSQDEISSLSFVPGWNFISAKTCKQ